MYFATLLILSQQSQRRFYVLHSPLPSHVIGQHIAHAAVGNLTLEIGQDQAVIRDITAPGTQQRSKKFGEEVNKVVSSCSIVYGPSVSFTDLAAAVARLSVRRATCDNKD